MRSAKLDRKFFDKIDTDNKAYILGIMFADGSITKSNQWILELHEQDGSLLYEIATILGLQNAKLCTSKRYRTLRLNVSSLEHVEQLARYGCIKNKTYDHREIILPEHKLLPSFWRGFFDGDGSTTCDAKTGMYRVSFAMSHPGLKQALMKLADELGARYTVHHAANMASVVFSGSYSQIIARYMYQSSGPRLKRKEEIVERLLSQVIRSCVRRMYAPEGQRWCSHCLKFKPIMEFYKRESRCITCCRSRGLSGYHLRRGLNDFGKGQAQIKADNPPPPDTVQSQVVNVNKDETAQRRTP